MSYILIISEKPQAAQKIANSFGVAKKIRSGEVNYFQVTYEKQNIIVASAVGHLFVLGEDGGESWKYPVFNTKWYPVYEKNKTANYTKSYIVALRKLKKEADEIIVACDFDIEGEVIGYNIIKQIFKIENASRMKFSSLTKDSIIKSFNERKKSIEVGQKNAGLTRHNLDWFYGINLSRAFTDCIKVGAKRFKVMSTGRVQAPALHMLCEKEKEIKKFISQKYFEIYLDGKIHNEKIMAQYYNTEKKKIKSDDEDENKKLLNDKYKICDEKEVDKIVEECKNKDGIVSKITSKKFSQKVPFPFDLTSLQIEASTLFGISPKRTLEIAQNLYINGWTSYPRTSSQKYMDTDLKAILDKLEKFPIYKSFVEIVKKINKNLKPKEGTKEDPAHPAIHPTGEPTKKLEGQDFKIYDLIVKRFFAVFGIDAIRETNKIIIDISKNFFELKASRTLEPNWHLLYAPYVKLENGTLPKVDENEIVKNEKIEKIEKQTSPPKRFTDASIIKELEKRNLGTKSTRAEILSQLNQRGYITDKSIKVTQLGLQIDEVISNEIPKIVDEKLTREFEKEMEDIRDGNSTQEKVLKKAKKELEIILKDISKKKVELGKSLSEASKDADFQKNKIRKCLKCDKGYLVIKTAHKTRRKFLACSNYPDCKEIFSLPQTKLIEKLKDSDEDISNPKFIYIMAGASKRNLKKILINKDREKEAKKLKEDSKKYPECGMTCPKCNKGQMILRKSYYGSEFLGCNNYPKCKTLFTIKEGKVIIPEVKEEK